MVLDKTLNTSHWFKKNHIWLILGYKFKVKIMTKLKMKDFHVTLKPPRVVYFKACSTVLGF